MWSFKPRCTCGSTDDRHYLTCDLMYGRNHIPRKKKRFGLFYPMKMVR